MAYYNLGKVYQETAQVDKSHSRLFEERPNEAKPMPTSQYRPRA